MKYLAIVALFLSACATTEPSVTCEQGSLQSCTAATWYTPWESPSCEKVLDAETGKEARCE